MSGSGPYAIMVLDAEGNVLRANAPMARALGRGIAEIQGQPYAALLGPAVRGTGDRVPREARDPLAECRRDGAPGHAVTRYARLPGTFEVSASALGDDRAGGVVVVLEDEHRRRPEIGAVHRNDLWSRR